MKSYYRIEHLEWGGDSYMIVIKKTNRMICRCYTKNTARIVRAALNARKARKSLAKKKKAKYDHL